MDDRSILPIGGMVTDPGRPMRAAEGTGAVWIHVEARRPLTFAILRDGCYEYFSHWSNGRSVPCPGRERCKECRQGKGFKAHYVFSIYDQAAQHAGLIDLPHQCATAILHECRELGFYRGVVFRAAKAGGKENGRLSVAVFHSMLNERELPDGPDPEYVLHKQWGLITDEDLDVASIGI